MSEQDDWAAFVALMERGGWVTNYCDDDVPSWYFGDYVYHVNGWLTIEGGRHPRYVGTWREWLAAGTSPVPF